MLNDNTDKNIYFPVFVVETKDTTVNRNTYQPQLLSNQSRTIASYVDNNKIVNNSDWGEVKRYFNIEMKQNMSASNTRHDERVKNMMTKLFDSDYKHNK